MSGIIGILYGDSQWFVGLPLNLTCLLFCCCGQVGTKKAFVVAFVAFLAGMIAEGLVCHGLILDSIYMAMLWAESKSRRTLAYWGELVNSLPCYGAIAANLAEALFRVFFLVLV